MPSITPSLKPIEEFPGYFAGDNGRIYQGEKETVLVPNVRKSKRGYLTVRLPAEDGEYRIRYVHLLIGRAWLGDPPPGYEVIHHNGHKGDNRPSNLMWGRHRGPIQRMWFRKWFKEI